MRTPNGLTVPRTLNGVPILGSFRAHQVPLPGAKTDDSQLKMLNEWLKSCNVTLLAVNNPGKSEKVHGGYEGVYVKELFSQAALRILPQRVERRTEMIKESYAGYEPLDVLEFDGFVDVTKKDHSPVKAVGGECFVLSMWRCNYLFRLSHPLDRKSVV